MYSSSSDLAKLGNAILNHTQLSPLQTRRWLKPLAHTSSLELSVGAPWEIWRTDSGTTDAWTVDLYTKAGNLYAYNSLLILIPDLQVTVAVLTAGPDHTFDNDIADIVVKTFLPELEKVSRKQAAQKLGGTYTSSTINSSLLLSVDDGPGLVVEKWISNGSDIVATAQAYSEATSGVGLESVRLYPMGPQSSTENGFQAAYRAVFQADTKAGSQQGRLFRSEVGTWTSIDLLIYGRNAVDDFLFHMSNNGTALSVEPRALNISLSRVS